MRKIEKLCFAVIVLGVVAAPLGHAATAADMGALKKEAVGKVKGFGGALKKELLGAIDTGGPTKAISVCNENAVAIADEKSTDGWTVARTSLKLRNPGNEPDAWELAVLKKFEERKAAGEDPVKMAFAQVVEEDGKKVFRFMKAIPTDKLCLTCHGTDIKPEVAARLDDHYPDDKARGFSLGDIRGAFTLRKPL